MKTNRIVRGLTRGLMFALAGALFVMLFSFFLMHLWNWLTPPLFGWHTISFWQAVGLLVLSKILFGGFRHGRGGPPWGWRRRMMERWDQMTPEEREKFRESFRGRCGPFAPPTAEPKA